MTKQFSIKADICFFLSVFRSQVTKFLMISVLSTYRMAYRAGHRAKSGRVIYLFFCAPTGHGLSFFLPRAPIEFRAGQKC